MNTILLKIFFFWLELQVSYDCRATAPNTHDKSLYNTLFCAYFKYNLKITVCLQLFYTPNDSSTTEDAYFMFKATKLLQLTSYGPTIIAVLLFCVQVRMTTKLGEPTTVLYIKQPPFY